MALDMTGVKNKQVMSKIDTNSSKDLKKALSDKQLDKAKSMYLNIRKSFFNEGVPMTRHDQELAELIRLKILDTLLAEEF